MTGSAVKHAPDAAAPNWAEVLGDALLQAKNLVHAELSLAKVELLSELDRAYGALLLLALGAICMQAALATLGVMLVLVFGVGFAAAVVVLVFALIGVACAAVALRALGRSKLPRTSARLALDVKQVLETVR